MENNEIYLKGAGEFALQQLVLLNERLVDMAGQLSLANHRIKQLELELQTIKKE